jgi:hypothetical protein
MLTKQLDQITRQSEFLSALKLDIENYTYFSNALRESISKLVEKDHLTSAAGDSNIQRLKFDVIVTILADYMYFYYDYYKYLYLLNVVPEIFSRKRPNADADTADLVEKL